ncbi:TetR family transcriptional regulator [Virgisporangium aliadipatigenens]|uniref:TetR family transcriptional regulator n=1 Tax=Virgisporangium aliadipatigenens TaxID=741659 RepID=A0A8J4DTW8_9ACTN|nr:TetR/AcrR family transcriptional regulator [Virgisporangium aliadipatigenens]GIJ50680.1 TetR family transcriptional regulator [Virgisporangium aliadipatigenens]
MTTSARRLQPQKREAILRAGRTVFGRDGYTRASIDAIATEAGVSTRTIYNHFANKEQLFATVLESSATQVADGFVESLERALAGVTDRREYLVRLGWALTRQAVDFPEHFAMVRQINPEARHFTPDVLDTWRRAGPLRVQREVARHLDLLAADGKLRGDAELAATHFMALTTAGLNLRDLFELPGFDDCDVARIVETGVDAFLHGYAG